MFYTRRVHRDTAPYVGALADQKFRGVHTSVSEKPASRAESYFPLGTLRGIFVVEGQTDIPLLLRRRLQLRQYCKLLAVQRQVVVQNSVNVVALRIASTGYFTGPR